MNIYDLIREEIETSGSDRLSDFEIYDKYEVYNDKVITKALKYAYGIIEKPSVTEVIFHGGEVFFPPHGEEEYEAFCHMTGGFHRSYWIDVSLVSEIGLCIEGVINDLENYLNSNSDNKPSVPIYLCGGL